MLPWPVRKTLLNVMAVLPLVSAGLLAFGLSAPAAAAEPDPGPCLSEAIDEATARQMAARCGTSVEVAESRSELERVFVRPNGVSVLEAAVEPQRTRLADGSWADVDLALRVSGGAVVPAVSAADVRFSAGGNGPLVTMRQDGKTLHLTWPDPLPEPSLSADMATYPEVMPDVDLVLQATRTGFTHVLVVKTPAAAANPAVAQIRFDLGGDVTVARRDDGGLTALVGAAVVAEADPAVMWDSRTQPEPDTLSARGMAIAGDGPTIASQTESTPAEASDLARVAVVNTEVIGRELILTPDSALLTGESTQFPVYIDPKWHKPNATRWAYATSNNTNNTDTSVARVGKDPEGSRIYRSFFEFPTSTIAGKSVLNAKVFMKLYHSSSCNDTYTNMWHASAIASTPRTPWSTSLKSWVGDALGHANKGSCSNAPQPDDDMWFDDSGVKTIMQQAASNSWSNITFGFAALNENYQYESDSARWKKFYPSQARLEVEYNSAPATPTNVKLTGDCVSTCSSGTKVRVLTPNLQATITDPEGDSMTAYFEVWNSGKTSVVSSGSKSGSSGATVTWTTATLANGAQYHVRVRAKDSAGVYGAWSSYYTFTTDTSGPGTPTNVAANGDCYQSCSSPAILRTAEPTLKAYVTHPFGDNLTVAFEVWNAAKTSIVTSGSKTSVPASTTPTWQPTSNLPQNQQLHLRVRSTDTYSRGSAWSGWYTFTADETAPMTPGVSSNLYTHKDTGTYNGGAGVPGLFTLTPGTSTDVVQYQWKLNGGSVTSVNVSAGASGDVTITPTADLLQLLEVRSVDGAGWASGWAQYPFLVRTQAVDVAYWKLDGNATPASGGTAYTGTLNGGPTFEASGINPSNPEGSGQAIRLDGTDDYVAVPKVLATDHAAGFSVSAWVKPDDLSTYRNVVAQQGQNTYAFRVYYKPETNKWCFSVRDADDTAAATIGTCSDLTPQTGVWTHLAGVYDPVAGKIRLYVNGGPQNQYVAGTVSETAAPTLWSASGGFQIGRANTSNYFDGLIDEVRVYQRVLPEAEVRQMFQDCWAGDCPQVPTPAEPEQECLNTTAPMCIGEWKLDENTGTTSADSSEQNNTLTFNGSAAWASEGYNGTSAVTFDGSSGYLETSRPVVLTDQSFTVSAWAKLTNKDGWRAVLTQDGTYHSAFRLDYEHSVDQWCFGVRKDDTAQAAWIRACGPTPKLGVWTHLVGVYDSSTHQIHLYVSGHLAGTATHNTPWKSSGPLAVGRVKHAETPVLRDWFIGQIDLVRAYQGALSDADVAALYTEQLAPPKLTVWWELEEFESPAYDYSESGNHGDLSASGAEWTEDGYGGSAAVTFDGVSGSIATQNPVLQTTDSFSVAAWVKLSGTGSVQQFVLSQCDENNSVFKLYRDPGNNRWNFAVGSTNATSDSVAQMDTWVHLVGVFDAATGEVRLYVNGVKQTIVGTGAVGEASVNPFTAGAKKSSTGYDNFFAGTIDAVRAYQGALSDAQAQQVFEGQEI